MNKENCSVEVVDEFSMDFSEAPALTSKLSRPAPRNSFLKFLNSERGKELISLIGPEARSIILDTLRDSPKE